VNILLSVLLFCQGKCRQIRQMLRIKYLHDDEFVSPIAINCVSCIQFHIMNSREVTFHFKENSAEIAGWSELPVPSSLPLDQLH